MKTKTFEDYLQEYWVKETRDQMIQDDDMPDAFDKWVAELDMEEILKIGDLIVVRATNDALQYALDCQKPLK